MQQSFRVLKPLFYLQNYLFCHPLIMIIINTCFDSYQRNTKSIRGYLLTGIS